jgi:serine/threonine protein phosphatase PrpC
MHATVVVLTIDPHGASALWGHVGDSRLYVLRRGALLTVTRDDSIVQWMVAAGYLDPARSREHPQKNRLLAALGAEGELAPHVPAAPFALEDGDAFLLCSDGWWDCMEPADVERLLADAASIDGWIDAMAERVAAQAKVDHDNYSAVVCWIGDPAQATRIVPVRDGAATPPADAPGPARAAAPRPPLP